MDTANIPAPWGRCILCDRRILTGFLELPGDGYTVRAHVGCFMMRGR